MGKAHPQVCNYLFLFSQILLPTTTMSLLDLIFKWFLTRFSSWEAHLVNIMQWTILAPLSVWGSVATSHWSWVPALLSQLLPLELSPVGQHQCSGLHEIPEPQVKDPVWSLQFVAMRKKHAFLSPVQRRKIPLQELSLKKFLFFS